VKHWYQPRYRFRIAGAMWSGDRYAAYRETPPGSAEDCPGGKLCDDVANALNAPVVTFSAPVCGLCVAQGGAGVAQAHHMQRAAALFGDRIEWRHLGNVNPFVGFVGGEPVAIVMPTFGSASYPPCPTCGGDGVGQTNALRCPECDGTGRGSETEPAFEVSP